MFSVKRSKSESGLALLETAAILGIIVIILIVVAALIEYCRAVWSVQGIVDRYVYDQVARPFSIQNGQNGALIKLDQDNIKEAIANINQNISSEVDQMLEQWNLSDSAKYYSETSYTEMDIDQQSGKLKGLKSNGEGNIKSIGDSSVKAILDKDITLKDKFEEISKQSNESSDSKVAMYAISTAPIIDGRSSNLYLPSTVLVGARVGISFENTWIGKYCKIVGIDPFVSKIKVIGLRGEIGL